MTTKLCIAAVAAIPSIALALGQSAHALAPTPIIFGQPPTPITNPQPLPPTPPPHIPVPQPPQMPPPPTPMIIPRQQLPILPPPLIKPAPLPVRALPAMPMMNPAPATLPANSPASDIQTPPVSQPKTSRTGTSNTYVKGTCTWYVKNKRPDLPNGLGNGGQWSKNAAARGYRTGSTPRTGAVAETKGHVAYVESVHGSTITISEMNYAGKRGVVHRRVASASQFRYIYS